MFAAYGDKRTARPSFPIPDRFLPNVPLLSHDGDNFDPTGDDFSSVYLHVELSLRLAVGVKM